MIKKSKNHLIGDKMKRQGGFITVIFVIVIISIVTSILAGIKLNLTSGFDNNSFGVNVNDTDRQKVFDENLKKLIRYIDANSNEFSKSSLPSIYTEEYILSKAGIFNFDSFRFRLGITSLQQYKNNNKNDTRNIIQGRDFYFWLQPEDKVDKTIFTSSSLDGVVTDSESIYSKISGRVFEIDKYAESIKRMDRVASILKTMYAGHLEADPFRDASANYFANPPCGYRPDYLKNDDTVGCSGSSAGDFAPLSSLGFSGVSGGNPSVSVSPLDLKTPWGGEIEITNIDTSGNYITLSGQSFRVFSKTPPYTVVLRVVTPSGFSILRNVVQPF